MDTISLRVIGSAAKLFNEGAIHPDLVGISSRRCDRLLGRTCMSLPATITRAWETGQHGPIEVGTSPAWSSGEGNFRISSNVLRALSVGLPDLLDSWSCDRKQFRSRESALVSKHVGRTAASAFLAQ